LVHEAARAGKIDCLTWLVAGTGGGQAHELHVPDMGTHLLPIHMAAKAGDHKMLRYIVANLSGAQPCSWRRRDRRSDLQRGTSPRNKSGT